MWVLQTFLPWEVCGNTCLSLWGIRLLSFLLGRGYLLVWGLWLQGGLAEAMVLPGVTLWHMHLVRVVSKGALCGPGARLDVETAEGLCLVLKINNCTGQSLCGEIQKCHFDY